MSSDALMNERVCWADMSNMTDTLNTHDYTLRCQVWAVTGLFLKLSIVLMSIAHPIPGKACLGRGQQREGRQSFPVQSYRSLEME